MKGSRKLLKYLLPFGAVDSDGLYVNEKLVPDFAKRDFVQARYNPTAARTRFITLPASSFARAAPRFSTSSM
jgi:hypothetical protein